MTKSYIKLMRRILGGLDRKIAKHQSEIERLTKIKASFEQIEFDELMQLIQKQRGRPRKNKYVSGKH